MPTTREAIRILTQKDIDAIRHRVHRYLRDGDIAPSKAKFTHGLVEACKLYGHIIADGRGSGREPLFYDKAATVVMRSVFLPSEYRYIDQESNMHIAEVREGSDYLVKASLAKYEEFGI